MMDIRLLYEVGGAFLAGGALSYLGAFLLRRFFSRWAVSMPGGRRQHRAPTPLLGGVAALVSILVITLIHPTLALTLEIKALLVGILLFLIVGAVDDKMKLRWPILFFMQCVGALILLAGGVRLFYVNGLHGEAIRLDQWTITLPDALCLGELCALPLLGSIVLVFWTLILMNAINWLDGTDGTALAVLLFSCSLIGIISLTSTVSQPAVAILSATAMGSALGLLPWNRSPAKLFIGSAGSFGFGFFLVGLSALAGAKVATLALVLLLPAADAAAVLATRIAVGAPVVQGDRRHLHHALERRGWSAGNILLLHSSAAFTFGLAALLLSRPWKLLVLLIGFTGLSVALFFWKIGEERRNKKISP